MSNKIDFYYFFFYQLTFQIRIPRDIVILDPSLKSTFGRGIIHDKPKEDNNTENEDDGTETEQGDDISDTSSVAESVTGHSKKISGSKELPVINVKESRGSTSKVIEKKSNDDQISRCSIGNRSIMEYQQEEEEDKREIIKDQGSKASRALITMRRSRAEGANNLKVYNVQDYFVINRCTLKVGIDMSNRAVQECKMDQISFEEADKQPSCLEKSSTGSELSQQKQKRKSKKKKPVEYSVLPELTLPSSKIKQIANRLTKTLPFQVSIM